MTLITLDQLGQSMDEIRAAVSDADGPEYGFCRGEYRRKRIWDWSRHCWRVVAAAEVGGKQPRVQHVEPLPDATLPMPDELIVMACEWLEEVGPKSSAAIQEKFDAKKGWCANWVRRCPGVMVKISTGNGAPGAVRTLYGAADGWRDAYAATREGVHRQRLNPITQNVLDYIRAHPGDTREMVANALGMTRVQVRSRERTLLRYDLIRMAGVGGDVQYWPVEEETHGESADR